MILRTKGTEIWEFLYGIRDIVAIEFILAKNTTNRTINYLHYIVNKQM